MVAWLFSGRCNLKFVLKKPVEYLLQYILSVAYCSALCPVDLCPGPINQSILLSGLKICSWLINNIFFCGRGENFLKVILWLSTFIRIADFQLFTSSLTLKKFPKYSYQLNFFSLNILHIYQRRKAITYTMYYVQCSGIFFLFFVNLFSVNYSIIFSFSLCIFLKRLSYLLDYFFSLFICFLSITV